MNSKGLILVVDDDVGVRRLLAALLETSDYAIMEAANGASALAIARDRAPVATLLDVRLGAENGLELISALKAQRPEMAVLMISGAGTVESAVEAMQRGADNFISKPVNRERLLEVLGRCLETQSLRRRTAQLERLQPAGDEGLLDDSPGLARVLALITAVAGRDTTVLITGETGCGKGVFARALHERSPRAKRPFVSLNCAGLQRELTESELFGHERGAFTGAVERKLGLLEAAEGGTLFLDEIGEMDTAVQPKLLKVIEDRKFRRLGGVVDLSTEVRLVAATHRDLSAQVAAGRFREDLLYRLNIFTVTIPPLRERTGDILPLTKYFLARLRGVNAEPRTLTDSTAEALLAYHWPGNVRELRNVIERAEILCSPGEALAPEHLPPLPRRVSPAASQAPVEPLAPTAVRAPESGHDRVRTFAELEREELALAVKACRGNLTAAARSLGIGRSTLYRKLRAMGVNPDESLEN